MKEKRAKIIPIKLLSSLILSLFSCSSIEKQIETFSIMSWNIYLNKGDSESCIKTLESNKADFYIFQEANDDSYKYVLDPFLDNNSNYEIINVKVGGKICYMPIVYNLNRWNVMENDVYPLIDRYETAKGKTLSYAVFINNFTQQIVSIINFHGAKCLNTYNGYENYSKDDLEKIENLWHIGNVNQGLNLINEIEEKYGEHNVVFGGDCNFNSLEEPYMIFKDNNYKSCEENYLDNLKSTHPLGKKPINGLSIDHLFVSKDKKILTFKKIMDERALIASDHTPIFAKIEIE